MKISIPKSLNTNIIEYLFAIILILNCNTIWTSYEETAVNRVLKVALVAVVALYVVTRRSFSNKDLSKIVLSAGICTIYFLIYALIVNYATLSFLYFVIDVFCIYVFVLLAIREKRGIEILRKYEIIMVIIAVISLFFWLFGSILGLLHTSGTVYSTWTGGDWIKAVPTYYNLYFETQSYLGLVRNTGIFTEAPMYNFNLCIALLVELFCNNKTSKAKCGILVVTIITTISTTGWCMLIIALFVKYAFDNNIKGFLGTVKIIVVPVALIVGIVVLQILVLGKLDSSSGSTRLDDFVAGFEAWKTHPLFGAGFSNGDYVKRFMSSFRSSNQGFSNSPMQILYQGGLFLLLPYAYFMIKWVLTYIKRKDIKWLLFFGCFLYLFIITVVSYRFITVFLLMASGFERSQETSLAQESVIYSEKSHVKDCA